MGVEIETEFDHRRKLLIRRFHDVDGLNQDLLSAMRGAVEAHTAETREYNALYDLTGLRAEQFAASFQDMVRYATRAGQTLGVDFSPQRRIAYLVGDQAMYGVQRMFIAAIAGQVPAERRVFMDQNAATAWLTGCTAD